MKNKLKNLAFNTTPSLIAILLGLLFGFVIIFFAGKTYEDVFYGINALIMGIFYDGTASIGTGLARAVPIILTGLAVGFAFKTGLFNIGASGQFTIGAFLSILIGIKGPFPGIGNWLIAVIVASVAGALWAAVPGILKAYRNVNEVISSIMMNYIGMYLVQFFIVQTVLDKAKNQTLPVPAESLTPTLGLDKLFDGAPVDIGIFIAIAVVIFIYILLNKTTFGFELKACGFNQHASRYAGINAKRNIVYSMMISGALAGLAGALVYLSANGKHIELLDVLAPEGFTGISVALLGLSNPIGILFAGLFIVHLQVGGFYMQTYGFAPEVVEIIISAIIYFSSFIVIFKMFLSKRKNKKEKKLKGGKKNV